MYILQSFTSIAQIIAQMILYTYLRHHNHCNKDIIIDENFIKIMTFSVIMSTNPFRMIIYEHITWSPTLISSILWNHIHVIKMKYLFLELLLFLIRPSGNEPLHELMLTQIYIATLPRWVEIFRQASLCCKVTGIGFSAQCVSNVEKALMGVHVMGIMKWLSESDVIIPR